MNSTPRTKDGVYIEDLEEDEGRGPEPDEVGDYSVLSRKTVIKAGWCPDCKRRRIECACNQEPEELDFERQRK